MRDNTTEARYTEKKMVLAALCFIWVATILDQRVYSVFCEPCLMIAGDEDPFMSAVQGS